MRQRFRCRVERLDIGDGDLCVIIFTGQRMKTTRNPICICLNFGAFYFDLLKNKRLLIFKTTARGFAVQDVSILVSTGNKRFNHIITRKQIIDLLKSVPLYHGCQLNINNALGYMKNAI